MDEENKDGTQRVRHVPIHVESRDTGRLYSPRRGTNSNHHQKNCDQYQEELLGHRTLPNTSSININYKPTPPMRYSSNQSHNSEDPTNIGNNHYQEQQHLEHQFNQERPISTNPSPSQDSKLVNSPEPIPLPPPSNSEQHNNSNLESSCARDTQQNVNNNASHGLQTTNTNQERGLEIKKDTSLLGTISSIKMEVTNLLKKITMFDGISAKSKEYRYLDEMLTRCMIGLDDIQCGDSSELRQQRKATIKLVDQATDILQRKLQINSDIHDLSESMSVSSS